VVIDKFTKYVHFVPLSHPFTALQVAQLYMNHIYKLHGLPQAIISDRDIIFTSSVWQQLFKLSDTQLCMSSSYHPQTDGQNERLNQCLEGFLRCTVHSCPKQWSKWLPVEEFWYNTTYHSALGRTPFEVLYGHQPRHFGISDLNSCSVPELEAWLKERDLLSQLIKQQLLRVQQRMKSQADKGRSEREFSVGDMVYLKLQPYIQTFVASRTNQKLAFHFFGPFKILQKVGKVAYKVDLPADCKIHPVIHVSQLKKHVPAPSQVISDLSVFALEPDTPVLPVACLDRRLLRSGASTKTQLLIQWAGIPSALATWEEIQDLHWRFPATAVWGQPAFQEGRNVTTPASLTSG